MCTSWSYTKNLALEGVSKCRFLKVMSARLDLVAVLGMSQAERKERLSRAEARELGLKVVDAAGGGIQWVGSDEEYQRFLRGDPIPVPGARAAARW